MVRSQTASSANTDTKFETMKTIDLNSLDIGKTVRIDARSQYASLDSPGLKPSINDEREDDHEERLSALSE